jgi:hypothetical protein
VSYHSRNHWHYSGCMSKYSCKKAIYLWSTTSRHNWLRCLHAKLQRCKDQYICELPLVGTTDYAACMPSCKDAKINLQYLGATISRHNWLRCLHAKLHRCKDRYICELPLVGTTDYATWMPSCKDAKINLFLSCLRCCFGRLTLNLYHATNWLYFVSI